MAIKLGGMTAYDVKEVCQLFNLTPQTVRKYLQTGKIKGAKFGVKWYVTEENIKAFLSGGEQISYDAKQ